MTTGSWKDTHHQVKVHPHQNNPRMSNKVKDPMLDCVQNGDQVVDHILQDSRNSVAEWRSSVVEQVIVTLSCGLKTMKKHQEVVAGMTSNEHNGSHGS